LFDFGNTLRIWAYVSASGVFVESISNAGMSDGFGIAQLSGKPGERPGEQWKHGKVSVRELEARRQWESLFSFCRPGSHDGARGD